TNPSSRLWTPTLLPLRRLAYRPICPESSPDHDAAARPDTFRSQDQEETRRLPPTRLWVPLLLLHPTRAAHEGRTQDVRSSLYWLRGEQEGILGPRFCDRCQTFRSRCRL
ncbi:hypothetical protein K523DRAFT_288139, partial [Schizophyllum commune Tattone D]